MKNRICVSVVSLFLLTLSFTAFANADQDSAANADYESAIVSYEAKAYKEAFIHIKNVLQANPDYLPAHLLLANLYFETGLWEQAHKTYLHAYEKGADPNLVLPNWSRVLVRLRKSEQILAIDVSAGLSKAHLAQWRATRAEACLLESRPLCAQREYDELLTQLPDHPLGLNGLALLAIKDGQYKQADTLLQRSLAVDDSQALTWWALGRLASAKGDVLLAQRHFNNAYLISPNNAKIARSLIDAYVAVADLDAALLVTEDLLLETEDDLYVMFVNSWLTSQIDALSNIRPQLEQIDQRLSTVPEEMMIAEPSLFYLRGMVALMQGNFEQARDNFTLFTTYSEPDLQTAILLATTNMALGDKKAAMLGLQNHEAELIKQHLQQAILLGSLYLENARNFKAVRLLSSLSERYPHSVDVALFAVRVEFSRGKFKEAAEQLNNLLEQFPNNRQVLVAYSLYFLDIGETQKAAKAIATLRAQFADDIAIQNMYAAQLLIEKKYAEADVILSEVLKRAPELFAARYNQATMLINKGLLDDAEAILLALENEKGNHLQVVFQLANIDMRRGDFESADRRYRYLLQKFGPIGKITFSAVAAMNQQRDYRSAIAVLRKLEVKEPGNPLALVQLATFYIKANDAENAKSTLLKLELIFDRPVNVLVSESQNWLAMGDKEKALNSMDRARLLQPESLNLQLQWVKLLLALNKLERAESSLSALIKSYPNHPQVLFKFGELAQQKGRPNQAMTFYQKVLNEDENFDLAYAKLYALSVKIADFSALITRLTATVERQPDRYFTRNLLAQYHYYYGDANTAINHYLYMLELAPEANRFALYNRLAKLHLPVNKAKSLHFAEQAYRLQPKDADVLHTYGWALTINDQPEASLPLLREASVRNATSLSLQYHLAYTLVELENDSEAKRILRRLVKLSAPFEQREQANALLSRIEQAR